MKVLNGYENMFQYINLVNLFERAEAKISALTMYIENIETSNKDSFSLSLNNENDLKQIKKQIQEQKVFKETLRKKILKLLSKDKNLISYPVSNHAEYSYCQSCNGIYPSALQLDECISCHNQLYKKESEVEVKHSYVK